MLTKSYRIANGNDTKNIGLQERAVTAEEQDTEKYGEQDDDELSEDSDEEFEDEEDDEYDENEDTAEAEEPVME